MNTRPRSLDAELGFNSRNEDVENIYAESGADYDVGELQPSQTAIVVVSVQEHCQSRDTSGIDALFADFSPKNLYSTHRTNNNTPDGWALGFVNEVVSGITWCLGGYSI